MSRYDFRFGESWISELGARSTEPPDIEIAQRDFEMIKIAGKNGDEYVDNGRYDNVPLSRDISFIGSSYYPVQDKVTNFINEFAYLQGYQAFEDTDHNDLITEAVLMNFGDVKKKLRTLRSATLKFSRKPFWYLKSGLEYLDFDLTKETPALTLHNPFPLESKPIFQITTTTGGYSAFSLEITTGGSTNLFSFPINASASTIVIDCEKKTVKVGSAFANVDIPEELSVGDSAIHITSGKDKISSAKIAPRWRCL